MKVNETYQFTGTEDKFRIIATKEDIIYYIFLEPFDSLKIRIIGTETFQQGLAKKEIEPVLDPYLGLEINTDKESKSYKRTEKKWQLIQELWLNHKQELLDKKTRNKLLIEFSKQQNYPYSTLRLLLINFLKKGMSKAAVTPNYASCGAKGKKRKLEHKNAPIPKETPLTWEVLEIFKKSYRKFYLSKESKTITDAYEEMIDEFFKKKGKTSIEDWPSYYQFWRFIKEMDKVEKTIKKNGEKEFNLNHRFHPSSANSEVTGIGDIFEVDANILDCHVVSRSNRNKVLGRPTLYIIIDRYSRLIVGMNVSLDNPSWVTAVSLFENMVEDKVEYCAQYGIEIKEEDWPFKGMIPYSIIGDRGEMISKNSNRILDSYHIHLLNPSSYRGDLKPIVERSFGIINKKIRSFIDGAVIKDSKQRGDKDPRDYAKLNLDEITQVCIHCVLYMNKRLIRDFDYSEDQLAHGIAAIPIELWSYAQEHFKSSLREVNIEDFRLKLLPKEKKVVKDNGITLFGLRYIPIDSETTNWFLNNQGKKAQIIYDPKDMDTIYLERNGNFEPLILSEANKSFKGMQLIEIEAYQKAKRKVENFKKESEIINRIELNTSLKEINRIEIKKSISQSARKKNIKQNRKEEILKKGVETSEETLLPDLRVEQDPLTDNYKYIEEVLKGESND